MDMINIEKLRTAAVKLNARADLEGTKIVTIPADPALEDEVRELTRELEARGIRVMQVERGQIERFRIIQSELYEDSKQTATGIYDRLQRTKYEAMRKVAGTSAGIKGKRVAQWKSEQKWGRR